MESALPLWGDPLQLDFHDIFLLYLPLLFLMALGSFIGFLYPLSLQLRGILKKKKTFKGDAFCKMQFA